MNRSMVAGIALIAGIVIASPILAWSADDQTQTDQAAPTRPGMPPMGRGMMGGMGMMGSMPDYHGPGAMDHQHGWMQGMMHRVMHLSPQQRCEERLARRAAMIAYTVSKLNLTAEQRPLLDKLREQTRAGHDKEHQLCASLKPRDQRGQETVLDRVNLQEQFLSAHLQAIQQARPALEQFYQALTPAQKAIMDHPLPRG